ncbi:hypothetical protein [Wolbachia endosymbiont (group A) of Sphecodes monilicornis]|uniref:hypothetical protein n=1 Tax=Wolbachia endosymbiont (group A) of Sphecodes monilicornis TaxID=2954060 RepID=UPI002225BFE1|nr:hypothetical protein [Wolbachia endosymbiont (group A) of Sphecodes monilicornis]
MTCSDYYEKCYIFLICRIRFFPFCMFHLKKTHFKLFCCNKIETKVLFLALFG